MIFTVEHPISGHPLGKFEVAGYNGLVYLEYFHHRVDLFGEHGVTQRKS